MKKHLLLLTLLSVFAFAQMGWSQTTYTWNSASGDWSTAGNWTPSRDVPATTDILVFDGSVVAAPTVTNIPGQTIGQLKIINNCTVTVSSAIPKTGTGTYARASSNVTGTGTLFNTELLVGDVIFTSPMTNVNEITAITSSTAMTTSGSGTLAAGVTFNYAPRVNIGGGTGDDFIIGSGSTLSITVSTTASPLIISMLTGTTGDISGTFISIGNMNKILVADAAALVFESGSICRQGESGIGSLFATTGIAGVAVFKSGSVFDQVAASIGGSNPFGLSSPNSKATFQAGSLFKYRIVGGTPSFSGRTYPNFEYDPGSGSAATTGGSVVSINDLTITSGTLNMNMTAATGHSIKGNVFIASGATLNFNPASAGTIFFNGTSAQTISGPGAFTQTGVNSTLAINNASGVTINKSITLIAGLTLTSGNLTTSSTNLLTLGAAAVLTGGSATSFINGPMAQTWAAVTATKTYPLGKDLTYRPLTISLTTPASPVISAEVFNTDPLGDKGLLNAVSKSRYYQTSLISGTAANGGTAKITFGSDDYVTTNTTLVVAQSSTANGTYTSLGNSVSDVTSVTSVSYNPALGNYLILGDTGSNTLPVELSSFTSNLNGRNIQLNWETKTEKNSQSYVIERSLSGNAVWAQVGTVRAAGNSNSPKLYSFTEKNLQAGQYNYRLKMVDNDGKYEYSKTVEALVTLPKNFELDQNYPNPFNPSTKISYNLPNDSKVTLDIFNLIGERVAQLVNQEQAAGFYSVDFSNSSVKNSLSSGIYLYRIHAVDNSTGKDFSSIKKMILMK